MNGYFTSTGFRGMVKGQWMLFATESDYLDYIKEDSNEPQVLQNV